MNPFDRVKSPQPPPPGEDDLIDLTEVMEDGEPLELTDEAADEVAAEVVLDFRDGTDGLAALKAPAAPPEEAPPAPPAAPPEESLDDFLASLPELPEELDIPDNTLPLKGAAAPDLPPRNWPAAWTRRSCRTWCAGWSRRRWSAWPGSWSRLWPPKPSNVNWPV